MDIRFRPFLELVIPGDPHGKRSVRVVDKGLEPIDTSKHGWWLDKPKRKRKGVQAKKSDAYEKKVAKIARLVRKGPAVEGLFALHIVSVKKRPRDPHALAVPFVVDKPEGRLYCPVTPDWDNIGKSIGDGLKKGGVFTDDARIVDAHVTTLYGAVDEKPCVEVEIYRLHDDS